MTKWGHLGIVLCFMASTQVWAAIGKVSLLKGEAAASRDQQTIQLLTNSAIEEHDRIVTGANSQIQLTFDDKTVITLGSSSVMDVQEYLNDAQQPKAKFKFNQGTFKSITGEIGKKAPENFNLETKTATIGIRGTTVGGSVGSDGVSNTVTLIPDPNGGVGQIAVSNSGTVPVLTPDTIGCFSGAIMVTNAFGSVPVMAGSFTIVSPSRPPTPPAPLTPAQIQQLSASARPSQNTSTPEAPTPPAPAPVPPLVSETSHSVIAQSAQNTITRSANQAIENQENFTPSKGVAQLYFTEDYLGKVTNFSTSTDSDGMRYFDASATLYPVDALTGIYGSTPTILNIHTPAYIFDETENIENTNFKTSSASQSEVTIAPMPSGLSSYWVTLYYDSLYHEILIAKIHGTLSQDGSYDYTALIGDQSSLLSTSTPVLYYLNYDRLYINSELTSLTQSSDDATVLAINTTNRKVLGAFLDSNGQLQLSLGHVDAHNSLSVQTYSLSYYLDNALALATASYKDSDGALYGSANQALALMGIDKNYNNYNGITTYSPTLNIALLNMQSTPSYQDIYTTHQTLSGTIVESTYGTAGTLSDLSIQLNKSAGTLSVNSIPLSIVSTNSAFISDDFFAAITTGTYNDLPTLTSYLIAIPSAIENDYVSWGYWGKNSSTGESISATTSPFSTWVAGVKTDASYINELISSHNQSFTYTGSVIGSVYENGSFNYIKSTDNSAIFTFDFQHATYTSALAFKTSSTTWNSTAALALNGNAFNATIIEASATTANQTTINATSGVIQGNFYGPTANAVAGGFTLGNGTYQASGSFKAVK